MIEENIISDEQNENEDIDNSIDSNDEELDNAVSFEASNSIQSKEIDIITERLKEMNGMKSSSLNDESDSSSLTSSQTDYSKMDPDEESSIELDTLFDDKNNSHPTFTGASPSQDQAFQDLKSYLNYHCNIRSYDIPHTHDLVNSSGDYDRYYISKLETWVRKMHAEGKISSYDEDQLFKYLNRMK